MSGRSCVWARILAWLAMMLFAAAAHAHKPSDSYLKMTVDGAVVNGQWDIALRDLDYAIGLDANGDGNITWGEVRQRHAQIASYALARLAVRGDDSPCTVVPGEQLVDNHSDGAYTVLRFRADCAKPFKRLAVDYKLFADLDPQHRGLLNLQAQGMHRTAIFGPKAATQTFELQATSWFSQFIDYAGEGVWHIWVGYDHILFLLSLLLPAVLVWDSGAWRAADRFREAFWDVVRIVTSFTVAHSITLSLATLGVISLPSRWVESAIALSVVLAAINNVYTVFHGRRWVVAFAFGLIHGFGFASVLADLGLPQGTLLLALVGFNVGVECGQMAIVATFLPIAYAIRRTELYRRWIFVGGSAVIAGISAIWLAERLFNFKLLPF